MVEHEWFLALIDELLVHHVKHFEERGIVRNVLHYLLIKMSFIFWTILLPELYCYSYILSHIPN